MRVRLTAPVAGGGAHPRKDSFGRVPAYRADASIGRCGSKASDPQSTSVNISSGHFEHEAARSGGQRQAAAVESTDEQHQISINKGQQKCWIPPIKSNFQGGECKFR